MSSSPNNSNLRDISRKLVELARAAGAADADALAINDTGENIRVRQGKIESVEREDSQGVGLRAFVQAADGLAFASASSSDLSDEGLARLAGQVVQMAKISAADPDAVSPSGGDHPSDAELNAWNESHANIVWNSEAARDAALACEAAGLGYSPEIHNSEGCEAGFSTTTVAYAAADGFCGDYTKSSAGLNLSVIAGDGRSMQRDYAYSHTRNPADLRSPEELGHEAAERAIRRLGARSIGSREATVIFEPRVATTLLGHLVGAVNGRAVLQNRSFLGESKGEQIFPAWVNIEDSPDHPEGLGNRLFDGEGSRCSPFRLIENGLLAGFMTDRYAAGRLGTAPTGHARRGLTGDIGIGPSNLILQPGTLSHTDILKQIGNGILVTEMMGFGVNGVTGDYSRGAAGFLIENGEIAQPVQEITIAGNLKSMFAGITHLGSDLTWFGSMAVPTIAIGGLSIAGQQ